MDRDLDMGRGGPGADLGDSCRARNAVPVPVPGGREAFGSMTSGACLAGRSRQGGAWGARSDQKAGSAWRALFIRPRTWVLV